MVLGYRDKTKLSLTAPELEFYLTDPPVPFSLLCFGLPILPFLSPTSEFRHKLNFFGPLSFNLCDIKVIQ